MIGRRAALFVAVLVVLAASAVDARGRFRCFRPFSSLDRFSASSMQARENCLLDFWRVTDARVDLQCVAGSRHFNGQLDSVDGGGSGHSARGHHHHENGCYATIVINGEKAAHARGDDARYRIELRAINNSVVSYKGVEGRGYSVCCALLNGTCAQCDWHEVAETADEHHHHHHQKHQELEIVRCALHSQAASAADDDSDPLMASDGGRVVPLYGAVTKPLHRLVPGLWEARVTLLRRDESVGYVQIPFVLSEAAAAAVRDADAGNNNNDGAAAAGAPAEQHHPHAEVHAGAVVPVKSKKSNGDGNDHDEERAFM